MGDRPLSTDQPQGLAPGAVSPAGGLRQRPLDTTGKPSSRAGRRGPAAVTSSAPSLGLVDVRRRALADLEGCLDLLRRVHEQDGYPSTLADAAGFLAPAYEVAAWVAEAEDVVLGHVALHAPPRSATVQAVARHCGLDPADLLVLSRLVVAPQARGQGVARALLATARADAAARGRRAVLDVGQELVAAVALYESQGWTRVASERHAVGDEEFDLHVYLAPDDVPPRAASQP